MKVEKRIKELGFSLPAPTRPAGSYLPAVRTDNLLYVSGQLPRDNGKILSGKVGGDLEVKDGQGAARQALLAALAVVKGVIGDLNLVVRIVRVTCYVNSAPGFTQQAQVADGASDLLLAFFGEKGRHSRVSVGVSDLPAGAAVEIDIIVEVKNDLDGRPA